MRLKKISWRNFKSYSNELTELEFSSTHSLNLIVGENGAGKSSIAELCIFLLYGKIDSIKLAEIPNRINKNMYGKIELDCDGHDVVIERGIAPALFKVAIDGNPLDTAGKSNIQSILEENYYHIPYSVFTNMIILSVGDFKSLVDLGAADKRNIIDKIFGFTIYNNLSKIVRDEMRSIETNTTINNNNANSVRQNISNCNRQIEEMKNTGTVSDEELKAIEDKIKLCEEKSKSVNEMVNKIADARDKLNASTSSKTADYRELETKVRQIDAKLNLIAKGKCPTCGSSLETPEFEAEKVKLTEDRNIYVGQMNAIIKAQGEVKHKLELLDKKKQEVKSSVNEQELINLKSDLNYKKSLKNRDVSPLEKIMDTLNEQLQNSMVAERELSERHQIYEVLVKMFSEDGIKAYISSKYIPTLNGILDEMMNLMNINYKIRFDNSFDCQIMSNGYKVSYASLSTGEKKRVDFATVVSFIKLLKLQYGELNLIFLDELLSGIDVNGMSDMIDILKSISEELSMNIYLIHHAQLETSLFDNVLEISKPNGFSKINQIQ